MKRQIECDSLASSSKKARVDNIDTIVYETLSCLSSDIVLLILRYADDLAEQNWQYFSRAFHQFGVGANDELIFMESARYHMAIWHSSTDLLNERKWHDAKFRMRCTTNGEVWLYDCNSIRQIIGLGSSQFFPSSESKDGLISTTIALSFCEFKGEIFAACVTTLRSSTWIIVSRTFEVLVYQRYGRCKRIELCTTDQTPEGIAVNEMYMVIVSAGKRVDVYTRIDNQSAAKFLVEDMVVDVAVNSEYIFILTSKQLIRYSFLGTLADSMDLDEQHFKAGSVVVRDRTVWVGGGHCVMSFTY